MRDEFTDLLDRAKDIYEDQKHKLEDAETEISRLNSKIEEKDDELLDLNNQIGGLQKRIEELEAKGGE